MDEETTSQKPAPEKLLCPKAGTATSSPDVLTTFPTILNVMLWMKKEVGGKIERICLHTS
jgi:hypothetical protein